MSAEQHPHETAQGILGRPVAISQIGLVVRDLQTTMEQYTTLLGWGPWKVFRHVPPRLHDTVLRGAPAEFSMLGAETQVGEIGFELLQPLEGPSIYTEWLAEHGEGLHHVAVMLHDRAEAEQLKLGMKELGAELIMAGGVGDTEFFYLDTRPFLKIILESGTGHAMDLEPDSVYPAA